MNTHHRLIENGELDKSTHRYFTGQYWPAHLKPLKNEILSSWIVRLAHANGLKLNAFNSICFPKIRLWDRDVDNNMKPELIKILSRKTGVPKKRIEQMHLSSYGGTIFDTHHNKGFLIWVLPLGVSHNFRNRFGLMYCSKCLATDPDPYFRKEWRLGFVASCPVHKILLKDRCDFCGSPIMIHRGEMGDKGKFIPDKITVCQSCKKDLTDVNEFNVSRQFVIFQKNLNRCLKNKYFQVNKTTKIHSILFFKVLRQIFKIVCTYPLNYNDNFINTKMDFFHRYRKKHTYKQDIFISVYFRYLILEICSHLLKNWPERFIKFCHDNRLYSKYLLKDMKDIPYWFYDLVYWNLYMPVNNNLT